MFPIDLQGPDAGRIVNGRVLESTDLLSVRGLKFEELHVDLDMVTRYLFFITMGQKGSFLCISGQSTHPVAFQDMINAAGRDFDCMVPLQIPGNTHLAQMISLAKIEDFFLDFRRRSQGRIFGAGFAVNQSHLTLLGIGLFPFVKRLPADAEIPASLGTFSDLPGIRQNPKLPIDVPLCFCHGTTPRKQNGQAY